MLWLLLMPLLICPILSVIVPEEELLYETFQEGFMWGVATSAYQIEGGWDEGGKGLSNWDVWTENKTSGNVIDGTDGKVAADSYHKYKEDIALIHSLGLGVYRFSIAWARILPDGIGEVNEEGLQYYRNVALECLKYNITPMVTLSHFDMPYALEPQDWEEGEEETVGWLNPQSPQWFLQFARICFQELGDIVKYWITFNEPFATLYGGYEGDYTGAHFPPGLGSSPGFFIYQTVYNVLMAHAKVYRMYKQEFMAHQNGKVGITLNTNWFEPKDDQNQEDIDAAELSQQFRLGIFGGPIFTGDFPQSVKDRVAARSEAQGLPQSRLPEFSAQDIEELKGSADFLGFNFYTSDLVTPYEFPVEDTSGAADNGAYFVKDDTWYTSGSPWLRITPQGIRKALNWIKDHWNNPPVIITENGVSDNLGNLDDIQRIYYYKHYINNVLKASKLDGCNIQGYLAWSLLDNFEWHFGYTMKFGLVQVNFTDPDRTRTPKQSSNYIKKLAKDNGFIDDGNPCF